ncbi:MAG: DUF222 domain-containing protein [Nitriliruptoraceae bacterium]|nr:DUF222 domain-containing protein [Nitriliruptoraceae bacterium]
MVRWPADSRRRHATPRRAPGPFRLAGYGCPSAATPAPTLGSRPDLAGESAARYGAALACDGDGQRAEDEPLPAEPLPAELLPAEPLPAEPLPAELRDALATIGTAIEVLDRADLDAASVIQLRAELRSLRAPLTRLKARQSLLLATVAAREAAAAPAPRRDGVRRRTEDELGQQQGLTRGESRRAGRAGKAARESSSIGSAYRDGRLSERHVETLARALDRCPPDRRDSIEVELLALAQRLDVHAFAREARAIEHREAPRDAERRARFNHARRGIRLTDNRDGGLDGAGSLYGLGAERLRVAFDAFRTFDEDDERRSSEQRNADALIAFADAALRAGEAGTNRNIRPQVIVVAEADQLADPDGHGRFGLSQEPVRWSELGALLGDCLLSGMLHDAKGAPIAVSESVRTVPVGHMKALIVRDGGCTWEGCSRPWTQCDVAHGSVAFRDGGRLSIDNSTLLCFDHHPRFDAGGWRIRIDGDRVTFDRVPDRPPASRTWQVMLGGSDDAAGPAPPSARGCGHASTIAHPPGPAPPVPPDGQPDLFDP